MTTETVASHRCRPQSFMALSTTLFVQAIPVSRTARSKRCLRHAIARRPRAPLRTTQPARRHGYVSAMQVSAIPGGHDGETNRAELQKSYSVGVTIVSGCEATLRRKVIEQIVAGCVGKRVVVVTASSTPLTSMEEKAMSAAGLDTASANGVENGATTRNLEGWLACSSHEEMAEVVAKLAAGRECDYIVAEGATDSSGNPHEIAALFQKTGAASLRVDTLVSVLDGDRVLDDLQANAAVGGATRQDQIPMDGNGASVGNGVVQENVVMDQDQVSRSEEVQQSVAEEESTPSSRPMLIVSLVENANVIIVNRKSATASSAPSLEPVENMLSVLNLRANIVSATDGAVPVQEVVNTNLYDPDDPLFNASWKLVLMADRTGQKNSPKLVPKAVKDSTFVYRARRPFHPGRLSEHIRDVQTFSGVIRSTGKIWLATRMLAPLEWNQAGEFATLELGPRFWAARPESEWPTDEAARAAIVENWDTQFGDRETELVFVGMGVDKERLQGLLDGCLLQDEEMVFNNLWENFEDPFIEWVPLIEEDEEEDDGPSKPTSPPSPPPPPPVAVREVRDTEAGIDNNATATDIGESVTRTGSDEIEVVQPPASVQSAASLEMSSAEDVSSIDSFSSADPSIKVVNKVEVAEYLEGDLSVDDVSVDTAEKTSALDVLSMGFSEDSDSPRIPQPADDGHYDEEDVVLSSGEGSVADGILQQIPRVGLPVTIVTGFLGSGKTTLLNYILTAPHGMRIAVLVNEFGEIDIDSQLVEKGDWSSDDEIMELANGCICCNINDSFVNAIKKILERKNEVDYLIVETSGVADPVPVLNSLMVSEIADDVRVDGVLTLVDAEMFASSVGLQSEVALSQITAADTILLSKTDVASEAAINEAISFIKAVRPAARILRSQRGRIPIGLILDVGVRVSNPGNKSKLKPVERRDTASSSSRINDSDHERAGENSHSHSHAHDHSHDHDHDHDHECGPDCTHESHAHEKGHLEVEGFMTTSFRSDQPLIPELFMEKFLQRLPEGVFRAKGLLYFYGYGQRYIFQLSGRRYSFEEDEWPNDVAPGNQLVIIGRDLNIEELRKTLEACHAIVEE